MLQSLGLLFLAFFVLSPAFGQGRVAIEGVTVIDGTDHVPRQGMTVVVRGTKIISIRSRHTEQPPGTKIVDGTGKFLIPGLWNNDLHGPAYADAKEPVASLVSYGITTVRDMGAPLDDIVRLRASSASGTLVGPRIFIAGPLLEGPVRIKMALIVDLFSEQEARDEVKLLKQRNVDYIEVDTTLTPELYRAVADEARRQRLRLVGHIPAEVAASSIVQANQGNVEHLGGRFLNILIACSRDEDYFNEQVRKTYDDLLAAAREKRQGDEPQFKAGFDDRLLATFDEEKAHELFRLYARHGVAQTPTLYVLKTLWETNKENHNLTDRDLEAGTEIFAKDLQLVGQMKKSGVLILAGTDGPYSEGGAALHSELELLVQAGLTPQQAIQSATRDAAQFMGVSKTVGTVERGKIADLVLLDADPMENISNTRRISAVFLRGRYFSRAELSAMRGK
jgi:imidazolonepropionase-like amidohydrolase